MAAVAQPIPTSSESRWIIGRGVDLSLVIGSGFAGYVYLLLFVVLHVPMSFMWWFWSLGFDGTHIFGTASRTFFDKEARARNRDPALRKPDFLLLARPDHGAGRVAKDTSPCW